jgi:hypothetical protein
MMGSDFDDDETGFLLIAGFSPFGKDSSTNDKGLRSDLFSSAIGGRGLK